MKLFSYDSKFSQAILKLCYSCYLNLLWFLCSIPVFTAGAATTALYDVTLRISRGEDPSLTSRFFRAFRENFRQSTILWLILLALGILLSLDGYILYNLYKSTHRRFFRRLYAGIGGCDCGSDSVLHCTALPVSADCQCPQSQLAHVKKCAASSAFATCSAPFWYLPFISPCFFVVVAFFTPLVIFGEGLCALLSSYLLNGVIRACSYVPEDTVTDNGGSQ